MAMIYCSKNHYYDDGKHDSCPFCKEEEAFSKQGKDDDDDQRTIAMYDTERTKTERNDDLDILTVKLYTDVADTSNNDADNESDLTVGWLVCVEGGSKGRDYRVISGRNKVGRDYTMDICIQGDDTISREDHCAVIYDDRHNLFYLMPLNNMVYVKGQLLSDAVELKTGDEFEIGNSKFVFVAFCEGDRSWKNMQ